MRNSASQKMHTPIMPITPVTHATCGSAELQLVHGFSNFFRTDGVAQIELPILWEFAYWWSPEASKEGVSVSDTKGRFDERGLVGGQSHHGETSVAKSQVAQVQIQTRRRLFRLPQDMALK